MRVAFVSYDDEPPLGGQGVMLAGMRRAVVKAGVEVDTVAGHGHNAIAFRAVLQRPPLDFSLHVNRKPSLLLRSAPDVVHALGGPGGVLLLRRLPVPLVYTANHTYRQAYHRGQLKRMMAPLELRAYRNAHTVLALSASTADAVIAMGVSRTRVEVVMPGVDIPEDDSEQHEAGRVLFVGRLEPEKGIVDALAVMRELLREGVAQQAVIIGDGALAADVRQRISGEDNVSVRGHVDVATLRAEYQRASIVIMPSRYEGLGLVALEAQAAGTPVVGYDVDGLRDAVQQDGALVPLGDWRALYQQAAALLGDDVKRSELGARARQRMREEHAWPVIANQLLEVYDSARAVSG